VRIANASRFGLNFSLWTRDTVRGRRMAARLQAGTVNINEGYIAAWGSVDAPMGGMKDSGWAGVTAPTGSSSTPSPKRSRCSGCCRWDRCPRSVHGCGRG